MITEKPITAEHIQRLLLRVYRRYQSGAITEAQATKESNLLTAILKAIAITDLDNQNISRDIKLTLDLD